MSIFGNIKRRVAGAREQRRTKRYQKAYDYLGTLPNVRLKPRYERKARRASRTVRRG